jgi:hypothetical protein
MHRTKAERRESWRKHYQRWANRSRWGGKHMYPFGVGFPAHQAKYIARGEWERLEEYNEVDYSRQQWKADTARIVAEQMESEE